MLIVSLLYFLILASSSGTVVNYRSMAAAASSAFTGIAYLQIALICLLAPVFMAGAIAQEANPKTWDILLTSPLSAAEIVLGNLFGRLFFILALLFSSLPLFALTQYFGGVPGRSIFISYLIAGCAALLVGSIAISLSVSRLVGKRAVFTFYVGVVSYLAVTWAIDLLVREPERISHVTALNPFLTLRAVLSPSTYQTYDIHLDSLTGIDAWFKGRPVTTWCVLSAGLSLLLMGASTFTVRLGGLAQFTSVNRQSANVPWYRRMFGLGGADSESRPARQVWHNAIAWREAAARNATLGRMLARWSFIAAGGLLGLAVVLNYAFGGMTTNTFRTTVMAIVWGELAVLSLIAINMSATAVAREREDGTLDLILTTPITPSAYLVGKLRGLVAYLLPLLAVPLGTLMVAGLYVGLVQASVLPHGGGTDPSASPHAVNVLHVLPGTGNTMSVPAILPEAGLVATIVTIPFIAVCVMVGLQSSLRSKGSIGSVVSTVSIIGVLAGIVGLCAWKAGTDLPVIGPAVAASSPAVAVFGGVSAENALEKTIEDTREMSTARIALFVGAMIAAGIYLTIVYGVQANMVRTFDMTVRKLAGTS